MKCFVIFFVIAQIQRAKTENEVNKLQSRAFSSEEFSKISDDWSGSSFSNSSEEVPISPGTDDFLRPPNCGISNATQNKMYGGELAKRHQFPWMVALGYLYSSARNSISFQCGGSLITEKHVLTAAHCIYRKEPYLKLVRLGALDILYTYKGDAPGQDIFIDKIIPHEKYGKKLIHDIGIVTLIRKIIAPMVWPICLPLDEQNYAGKTVTVAGWGVKYRNGPRNTLLEFIYFKVFTKEKCREQFKFLSDSHNVMCAADPQWKQTICNGDSGGPLMYKVTKKDTVYYAIGLASFVSTCIGTPGKMSGFTEIFPYLDWIRNHVVKK